MKPLEIISAFASVIDLNSNDWQTAMRKAEIENSWFTENNIVQSLLQWKHALTDANIEHWLNNYNVPIAETKKLGIIGAGNIPLVCMHDVLCGLIAGFTIFLKTSSEDSALPKCWIELVQNKFQALRNKIVFVDKLTEIDAVIATGSNNTNRYFEYYFKDIPHLLRKNRNSVAVIIGDESNDDFQELGKDVFGYFGLGCRNVTHLLIPDTFHLPTLLDCWESYISTMDHNKYANNYLYHKAIYLMNLEPHLDTNYILLKESSAVHSPIGVLNYSRYKNLEDVSIYISNNKDKIQCVIGENYIPFGKSQETMMWDFADNVNTIKWLLNVR